MYSQEKQKTLSGGRLHVSEINKDGISATCFNEPVMPYSPHHCGTFMSEWRPRTAGTVIITSKNPWMKEQHCQPACHATSWSARQQLIRILCLLKGILCKTAYFLLLNSTILSPVLLSPVYPHFPVLQHIYNACYPSVNFIGTLLGFFVTWWKMADQSLEWHLRSSYVKKGVLPLI